MDGWMACDSEIMDQTVRLAGRHRQAMHTLNSKSTTDRGKGPGRPGRVDTAMKSPSSSWIFSDGREQTSLQCNARISRNSRKKSMLFINTVNRAPLGPAGAKLPQMAGGPCHWALLLDADENVTPRRAARRWGSTVYCDRVAFPA